MNTLSVITNLVLIILISVSLLESFFKWRQKRSLNKKIPFFRTGAQAEAYGMLIHGNNSALPPLEKHARLFDKLENYNVREKKRKSLMTPQELEKEEADKLADQERRNVVKSLQESIRLIAEDFFLESDKETPRNASMFGLYLIAVLEGKEPPPMGDYKPFPPSKAQEIKDQIESWISNGCPY